jgi:hypothetical protein
MTPIDRWQVCVVPLGGFKIFKMSFSLKILKNS